MDLFKQKMESFLKGQAPLADRMRPRTLDQFVGQKHIVGPGRLLRRAIQIDQLSSLIFYGPPGTGKTTLARIIANTTKSQFLSINAVLAGVKDIREAIESATKTLELYNRRTILFVDEVHRFNKAQQDALLPHVENGLLILIGATTENPYFEVNKALVSRSRIFQLHKLTEEDLKDAASMALTDIERGYGKLSATIDPDALDHLVHMANGDARAVLNALELAVETTSPAGDGTIRIDRATVEDSIQQKAVLYDKDGDSHYDTISAFIKSVRGSDPDAALYWMARMVYAGEEPRFIFRRMLILACEDIGMAAPEALGVVMHAAQAFDYVGMPEGRYHLAHACLYLATAPKSNSSMAFFDALESVRNESVEDVPGPLRDASRDSDGFGDGQGYLYPHAYRDHWVAQQYLPSGLMGKMFYEPSDQGYEKGIADLVARRREAQIEAMAETDDDLFAGNISGDAGKATTQWAQRTSGSSGEMLASIRTRLIELAGIGRESLVLDLCARTGLLALESARTAPAGGVWAVVHDSRSRASLEGLVRGIDKLVRPQIVAATWDNFDAQLRESAGEDILFSAIVGRNVIGPQTNKTAFVKRVLALLEPDGCAAFAETILSRSQRISGLLEDQRIPEPLLVALRSAEEAIYANPENPQVGWDEIALEKFCCPTKACQTKMTVLTETPQKRLTRDTIERWFAPSPAPARPSLGDLLDTRLDSDSLVRLNELCTALLAGKTVAWETPIAYVRIQKN